MEENEKIAIENYTYRLEEMKDSMEESLKNLTQIIKSQKKLVEIVSTATHDYEENEKKEFDDFCSETEKQTSQLSEQIAPLELKIRMLTELINRCHVDEEQSTSVSMLCKIIGLFKD